MLIGTSVCPWREQSILSQRSCLQLALTNRFLVFAIACFCFCSWAPSGWDLQDFKGVKKSLANQVNLISPFDATTRHCPDIVDFYMPPRHRSSCPASGLEKPAVIQPSIDAKKINGMRSRGHNGGGCVPFQCCHSGRLTISRNSSAIPAFFFSY